MPAFIPVVIGIAKLLPWIASAVYVGWQFLPEDITAPIEELLGWTLSPMLDWILGHAKSIGFGVAGKLATIVPDGWVIGFSKLVPYLGFADYMLGLQSIVKLVCIYYGTLLIIGVIRTIRGLMPRLGGGV